MPTERTTKLQADVTALNTAADALIAVQAGIAKSLSNIPLPGALASNATDIQAIADSVHNVKTGPLRKSVDTATTTEAICDGVASILPAWSELADAWTGDLAPFGYPDPLAGPLAEAQALADKSTALVGGLPEKFASATKELQDKIDAFPAALEELVKELQGAFEGLGPAKIPNASALSVTGSPIDKILKIIDKIQKFRDAKAGWDKELVAQKLSLVKLTNVATSLDGALQTFVSNFGATAGAYPLITEDLNGLTKTSDVSGLVAEYGEWAKVYRPYGSKVI